MVHNVSPAVEEPHTFTVCKDIEALVETLGAVLDDIETSIARYDGANMPDKEVNQACLAPGTRGAVVGRIADLNREVRRASELRTRLQEIL